MFRQIQYSWQSYDPLYFSFPKHYFMPNVPVYLSEYLLLVLMLKTLLELTFIPLTLHFFQNKNLRKKKNYYKSIYNVKLDHQVKGLYFL